MVFKSKYPEGYYGTKALVDSWIPNMKGWEKIGIINRFKKTKLEEISNTAVKDSYAEIDESVFSKPDSTVNNHRRRQYKKNPITIIIYRNIDGDKFYSEFNGTIEKLCKTPEFKIKFLKAVKEQIGDKINRTIGTDSRNIFLKEHDFNVVLKEKHYQDIERNFGYKNALRFLWKIGEIKTKDQVTVYNLHRKYLVKQNYKELILN